MRTTGYFQVQRYLKFLTQQIILILESSVILNKDKKLNSVILIKLLFLISIQGQKFITFSNF